MICILGLKMDAMGLKRKQIIKNEHRMTFIKFLVLQIVKYVQFKVITHLWGCPQKVSASKYPIRFLKSRLNISTC